MKTASQEKAETMKAATAAEREIHTRNILIADGKAALDDYCEYLAADAYRVTSIRESRDGRYWEVSFTLA